MLMTRLFYCSLICLSLFACNNADQKQSNNQVLGGLELDSLGKTKVTFNAPDGLAIVADYYPAEGSDKIIILCHQAEFSRGAYIKIASKLVEAGFDCLAVDLRSGKFANEVLNETSINALKANKPTRYQDSEQDIRAAINFAKVKFDKKIVLWGSSYSATLALMIGRDHPDIVNFKKQR